MTQWKQTTLGEICTLQNGRAYKQDELLSDGQYPVLRVGNFFSNRSWYFSDLELGDEKYCTKGDLLYAWSASFGPRIWDGDKVIYHYHIWKVEIDESKVDKQFLFHWFSWDVNRIRAEQGTGATMIHITKGAMEARKLLLPPLSEQKRIADILDKADAIRRKRQQAVEVTDNELLKSTFRTELGDPRTNPHGWTVDKLGDVINFVGGSQPAKDTFINEPKTGYVRLVQIRDFKSNKYPTYIPADLAKRPFKKDDVMIARYGPPVFQILRGLEGSYNVALMKAENTERTTRDFIFHLLQIPEIHDVVVANSERTAGQSGTNLPLLKNLEVPIPPVEAQAEIVRKLNAIEQYHAHLTTHLREAESLFNSLVQRAFKGELK